MAVYGIRRVPILTFPDFIYSHACFGKLVTTKGVAVYEIRGASIFTLSEFVYSHGFFGNKYQKNAWLYKKSEW